MSERKGEISSRMEKEGLGEEDRKRERERERTIDWGTKTSPTVIPAIRSPMAHYDTGTR